MATSGSTNTLPSRFLRRADGLFATAVWVQPFSCGVRGCFIATDIFSGCDSPNGTVCGTAVEMDLAMFARLLNSKSMTSPATDDQGIALRRQIPAGLTLLFHTTSRWRIGVLALFSFAALC